MKKNTQLTKKPLVKKLAKMADIPRVQADFIYDIFFDVIVKEIKAGNDVIFPNVGTLRLVKGREMRSNLTGQNIPPHRRLRFKVNVNLARFIRIGTREFPIVKK
jgi:nucleoid DNA-binding protein